MYPIIIAIALAFLFSFIYVARVWRCTKRFHRRLFSLRDTNASVAVGLSSTENNRAIFAILACDSRQKIKYAEFIYGRSLSSSFTIVNAFISQQCIALFTMPDACVSPDILAAFQNAAFIVNPRLKKKFARETPALSTHVSRRNRYLLTGWRVAKNQDERLKKKIAIKNAE